MPDLLGSSLELTMNIYTDPVLLDVGAAIDALPTFGVGMTALSIGSVS